MADRHKKAPRPVRMPGGLEDWYKQHADETGRSLNATIVAALEDYRKRRESGNTTSGSTTVSLSGTEIEIVTDDRQPPGTVSVVSRGEDKTEVRSFALAPDETVPEPENCKHPANRRLGDYCAACEQTVRKGKS